MTFVNRIAHAFLAWCNDPGPEARFTRTVAQGVVGVLAAGLTTGEWGAASVVGVVMAVISPVQAEIAKGQGEEDD